MRTGVYFCRGGIGFVHFMILIFSQMLFVGGVAVGIVLVKCSLSCNLDAVPDVTRIWLKTAELPFVYCWKTIAF